MREFRVVEIFCSPQGEGQHIGRRAVFVRFGGCNLGRGAGLARPEDVCQFCDTDFSTAVGMSFSDIVMAVEQESGGPRSDVVLPIILTGGEPLLQVDEEFIMGLHQEFPKSTVHVETNGTVGAALEKVLALHADWFWVTVSPKLGSKVVWRYASEVKVVVPGVVTGSGWTCDALQELRGVVRSRHYWIVPQATMDGEPMVEELTRYTECLARGWRFGVQGHKVWKLK